MEYQERSLNLIQALAPAFRPVAERAYLALAPHGFEIYSGFRSYKEQADLYSQGRDKPGKIVTKAAPGMSWHNWGRAIDLYCPRSPDPWADSHPWYKIQSTAKLLKCEWGGAWVKFPDKGHIQFPGIIFLATRAMLSGTKSPLAVKHLQTLLSHCHTSPGLIDGILGPKTQHAMIKAGLGPDVGLQLDLPLSMAQIEKLEAALVKVGYRA